METTKELLEFRFTVKSFLMQIQWIVKTDDDMVNNIWKLGYLVEALKYNK